MRESDLPSPDIGSKGHALRRFAATAISQLQTSAAYYPAGKHPDAATLRDFFSAAATALGGAPIGNSVPRNDLLVERWSAQDITGVANGAGVSTWTGRKAGIPVTQATAANQPVFVANRSANGKPSVNCTTNNKFLGGGKPAAIMDGLSADQCALVVVLRNVGAGIGGYGAMCGVRQDQGSAGMFAPSLNASGAGVGNVQAPSNRWIGWSPSGFTVFIIVRDKTNSSSRIYVNGSAVTASINDIGTTPGTGDWHIGFLHGSYGVTCELHEILVYSGGAMGQCDVTEITNWAFTEYGETQNLGAFTDYWLVSGDSTVAGVGAARGRDLGTTLAFDNNRPLGTWSNVAVPGSTMQGLISRGARDVDRLVALTGKKLKHFAYEYTNRVGSTAAVPAQRAEDMTYLAARRAAQPTAKMLFGNSLAMQADTVSAGGAASSTGNGRALYASTVNAYTVSDGVDTVVDTFSNALIGAIGANVFGAANGTQTYWADAFHESTAGYQVFADILSPLMNAA